MADAPTPKHPLTPDTPEFKKMYPNPMKRACLFLAGGAIALVLTKLELVIPPVGFGIGVLCGFEGLINSLAAYRVARHRQTIARQANS